MTKFTIFATARPTQRSGPLQPMSRDDAYFWANREREAERVRARREGKA